MKRRSFLLGTAAVGAAGLGGAYLMRPEEEGMGGHSSYFNSLSAGLREAGLARPTMVVDLDRVDRNVDRLQNIIGGKHDWRVVAKSLPSAHLLNHISKRADTKRMMVFHQPFLNHIAKLFPNADLLMGKPMPVEAVARFYDHLKVGRFDPAEQIQWLVDTPERLIQYQALANGRGLRLNLNVEIDVGLHRGGVSEPHVLGQLLSMIDRDPRMRFTGLMGYDAHVSKVPTVLGMQAREFQAVLSRYEAMIEAIRQQDPFRALGDLTLNAAGSPTFHRYGDVKSVSELAAGSAIVKASDFDLPALEEFEPAIFIATPVLKASGPTGIPALPFAGPMWAKFDKNRARTFFIYGGYWKANPVSPAGLRGNSLYGRSTNQEILNGSEKVDLSVDDYVFLRPTQSEFVMLQFGDLAVMRDGKLVDTWPTLQQVA